MSQPLCPSPEIVLNTGSAAPAASVVLLHGKGMRPDALHPFAASRAMPMVVSVPAGPLEHGDGTHSWWAECERPAGLAQGMGGDLFESHPHGRAVGRAALAAAMSRVRRLRPGLPVVLAGFSQGGMVALDHLLMDGAPLVAGLALLSSSCIALDEWLPRMAAVRGLPVLVAHGRADAELSFAAGERLRDRLIEAGALVRWLPFDGGHEMPLVVWRGLSRLLQDVAKLPK